VYVCVCDVPDLAAQILLTCVCVCVCVRGWVGACVEEGERVSVSLIEFVREIECEDELLNGDVLRVAAQVSHSREREREKI